MTTLTPSTPEDEQPYHVVTWTLEVQAPSPRDAAELAYDQIKGYGTGECLPPVLEISGEDGESRTIDMLVDLTETEDCAEKALPTQARPLAQSYPAIAVKQALAFARKRSREWATPDELKMLDLFAGAVLARLQNPQTDWPFEHQAREVQHEDLTGL